MTEAEKRVWQILRLNRMKGYKFRRQVPIGRYIVDFVCREARLIVEIDGGQHDVLSPQEAERNEFLQSEGYRILRFWNNEVLANLDGVHQTIASELGRITPTQTLPPSRGRAFVSNAPSTSCPLARTSRAGYGGIAELAFNAVIAYVVSSSRKRSHGDTDDPQCRCRS